MLSGILDWQPLDVDYDDCAGANYALRLVRNSRTRKYELLFVANLDLNLKVPFFSNFSA
jgi:hypothetical protein